MERSKKAVVAVTAIYALSLASFRGEFWPFSIFPMFSRGGRPWIHAVVRECSHVAPRTTDRWLEQDDLPCAPLPIESAGFDQNDLSVLVQNVVEGYVSGDRIASYFASSAHHNTWAVYQASGSLDQHGDPFVRYRLVSVVPGTRSRNGRHHE